MTFFGGFEDDRAAPGRSSQRSRSSFGLEEPSALGYDAAMKCPIHGIPLVCYCPACRGSTRSEQKTQAARENGRLGGRPKGSGKKKAKKGAK